MSEEGASDKAPKDDEQTGVDRVAPTHVETAEAEPTQDDAALPADETTEGGSDATMDTTEGESGASPDAPPSSDLDTPDPDALADPPDDVAAQRGGGGYAPSAPVITDVKPVRVDGGGGAQITVFGAGFVPGCRVYVGSEELIGEVVDAFTIRFVAPALVGVQELSIESPAGKRSPAVQLHFVEGPVVTRAVPAEGPTEGGVEVILEGRNFTEGCTVSLFGTHAPEVVFDSSQRIRFTLPPAGNGPLEGTLTVVTFEGLIGRADEVFRYRPLMPEIAEVEPRSGWVSGGKLVSLRGKDFHPKARVTLGGQAAVAHFRDAKQVDVEVPASETLGPVDIVLTNPDGRVAQVPAGFTYEPVPAPPKIIDVFPKSGLTTGGLTVRIVGDNFTEAVRVLIGDVTAMRRVVSAKLIDADVPPRQIPGLVAVELRLDDLQIRSEDAFTYESPSAPKITGLEPRSGPTGGGTKVVIEGESFPKAATVRFGGEACKSVAVKGPNRIEVVTPPLRSAGMVDVEVSSTETGPGVAPKAFRYEAMAAPVITSVSPARGTVDGGTELTVEGKNFVEGCVVLVGGAQVKTKRISGSVLEAYTPEGADGKLVDVAVRNPDGQAGFQKRAFQYDARYRS
jgi:hypothetical protein